MDLTGAAYHHPYHVNKMRSNMLKHLCSNICVNATFRKWLLTEGM